MMLNALSSSLMLFLDRILLSYYSIPAMNGVAVAGIVCAVFQFMALSLTSISGVFVGQYNGANRHLELGRPVWQMLWFGIMLFLIAIPIAYWGGPLLLPDNLLEHGLDYYFWIMLFFPLPALIGAISGFFIGKGKIEIIIITAIFTNIINFILDCLFIFGYNDIIISMGAKGAAIATVIAQTIQFLILLLVFTNKNNRIKHKTTNWQLNYNLLKKCLQIGSPNAIAHGLEMAAWAFLLHILADISEEHVLINTICSNFLILILFSIEGLQKGVTSVAANVIGAKLEYRITTLIRYSLYIHGSIVFFLAVLLIAVSNEHLVNIFLHEDIYQASDYLRNQVVISFRWVLVFFTFEGIAWITIGILTAAGDTVFIMLIDAFSAWLLVIAPIYIVTKYYNIEPYTTWVLSAAYAIINFFIFTGRLFTKPWQKNKIS